MEKQHRLSQQTAYQLHACEYGSNEYRADTFHFESSILRFRLRAVNDLGKKQIAELQN